MPNIDHLPDAPRLDEHAATAAFQKAVTVTAVAAVLLLMGLFIDVKQFWFAYLHGYVWALSIALGALFWNLIHHISAAGWSVVLRRLHENVTRVLPVLALLFVPIACFGMTPLYKWMHPHSGDMKFGKEIYLSPAFFIVRMAMYFAIWIAYSSFMRTLSLRMESTEDFEERKALLKRMEWWAPSGILLLGLTSTFASFDLVMSLNYDWFSTIFGVCFWADGIRGALAVAVLAAVGLRRKGYLRHTITRQHFHDCGKLMFGFTVFWAYVNFSQYFLYWYGNMQEETKWFLDRRVGTWYTLSILLPIFYFVAPLIILLPRANKRSPKIMAFTAGLVLFCQMCQFYWEIMPESLKENVTDLPSAGVTVTFMNVAAVAAFGGLIVCSLLYGFRKAPLIPLNDPRLHASIRHEVDEFGDVQE